MTYRFLEEDEDSDPILSVVNLVDVFLVLAAALMMIIAANPLNPFADEDVVIVRNPGKESMEMVVRQGDIVTRFAASGAIGEGEGVRAGVAYRLEDGSIVYVPEAEIQDSPAE